MKTLMKFRILITLSFFLFATVLIQAQTDKLKTLEAGVNNAKAKVAVNERKLAIADSLITKGTEMVSEAKSENKTIDADTKKLDKDHAAQLKPIMKLTTSKDKAEATKAKADMKAIETKYKADQKAIETRVRDVTKKQTTGTANIARGKTAKKTAQDALKASNEALKVAQGKYDAASAPAEEKSSKGKGKK
jgi:hypothetical protein